jgi:uncharacterized protein (TIRG00374 family)
MAQNAKVKISLKPRNIIIALLLGVGVLLLIPKIVGLKETFHLLSQVNKIYLFIALIFELLSYFGAAWMLGIILSRLKFNISFWDRFRIGSIAAFAIHFLPVGTLGEGALDYYFLHKKGVSSGAILLTLMLRIIITYSAFLMILLAGLVWVPAVGSLTFAPRVVLLSVFLVVFSAVIYIAFLYRNKTHFKKFWLRFSKVLNFVSMKIRKKPLTPKKREEIFNEIYKGIGLFIHKKRFLAFALLSGLVYWVCDILCFYFVFHGFGYSINFGVLILGYSVATLAGLISFIPGGVGVTEGSLGLVFSGFGVPVAVALTSIIIFRLFSFWIWIPIGLFSYISLSRTYLPQKIKKKVVHAR